MKHTLIWLLALGATPGFGGTPAGQISPIALYTNFQQSPPEAVTDALHKELESIMAPMGLTFDWRSLDEHQGNEVAVELAVLTFKGRCDVSDLFTRSVVPGALGWTHVSDGNILPFSDVDCDRIRGFVQRDLLAVRPERREATFGRAIARVVAHELYHIFAATTRHGSCGIGKPAYSVQDLLSPDFQFEGRESQALKASKAHAQLENSGRSPTP